MNRLLKLNNAFRITCVTHNLKANKIKQKIKQSKMIDFQALAEYLTELTLKSFRNFTENLLRIINLNVIRNDVKIIINFCIE